MVLGWSRPEPVDPLGQDPLTPRHGLGRPRRGQVGGGQVLAGDQRVGVARAEHPVADRGQVPPVVHGRPGQPRAVQALPGAQQQRMTAARPQQVTRDPLEVGGARAQLAGRHSRCVLGGPGLQQRVRGRPRRPVQHRVGHRGPDRRLDRRAHPHHRRRAAHVQREQARPLHDAQPGPDPLGVGRGLAGPARHVAARGRRGEHRAGDPVPVQQRGQGQQRLRRAVGRQPVGLFDGERPGNRGGRRSARPAGPPRRRSAAPAAHEDSPGSPGRTAPNWRSPRWPGRAPAARSPGPRPGRWRRGAGRCRRSAGPSGSSAPRAG